MDASQLDVHEASPQERLAAFANVFEVWPQGPDLQTHVQRRNRSVQHRRARWFVGVWQGQVVVSLGVYPVRLLVSGRAYPAAAIGSVHTVPQFRRRGLASQLLRRVEQIVASEGTGLALLYSDVAPQFYQRLGYQLCPAWEGWLPAEPQAAPLPDPFQLRPATWEQAAADIQQLYSRDHARRPLAYDRSPEYWEFLFHKWPQDRFLLAYDQGTLVGYARIHCVQDRAHLVDWALAPGTGAQGLARLLHALIGLGSQHGWRRVGGWLPPEQALRGLVSLKPRQREITMVKSLDRRLQLDARHREAAAWFLELDHV